ncbi:MAG: hypothetical protein ABI353_07555 [Isosphaeraceae bacterium]
MRAVPWLIVILGLLALGFFPSWAPRVVLVALTSAILPVAKAWNAARGTALRAALAWWALALTLGMISQVVALGEPWESGRPGAGHWTYLATLATLAATTSVLNARRPGGSAWALLMGLLVLVFLLPWMEGAGLAHRAAGWARLRLEAPWTLFYGLLVLAGVTNYLPTRYGLAAFWLTLAFVTEYLALTQSGWDLSWRGRAWSAVPLALAAAPWSARVRSRQGKPRSPGLERLWPWFRDHWGVVWALRVQERFNRTAQTAAWPIRLAWHGLEPAPGLENDPFPAIPDAAEATLLTLLRRFADPGRLREAAGR